MNFFEILSHKYFLQERYAVKDVILLIITDIPQNKGSAILCRICTPCGFTNFSSQEVRRGVD